MTRFTFLLLLQIQRYMWRNHIPTWAYAKNSGRNLDLKMIQFSYFCNIIFVFDLNPLSPACATFFANSPGDWARQRAV